MRVWMYKYLPYVAAEVIGFDGMLLMYCTVYY